MRPLLLVGLVVAAALLAAACGGSDSGNEGTSPTAGSGSPTPPAELSAEQVITLTQEFFVVYRAENPDGTFRLEPSTMNARVALLCADDPKWSASQSDNVWHVRAECKKEESGTPAPYGFELLRFEWLYYPEQRQVMPVSQAAHDAQYPFPQPSPLPVVTPVVSPTGAQ